MFNNLLNRKMVLYCIAYIMGIVCYTLIFPRSTTAVFLLALILITGIITYLVISRNKRVLPLIFSILLFITGFGRIYIEESNSMPIYKFKDESHWITGQVITEPTLTQSGYNYSIDMLTYKISNTKLEDRIRVYIDDEAVNNLKIGDKITFFGEITQPEKARYDGDTDYYLLMQSKDVSATVFTNNYIIEKFEKENSLITKFIMFGGRVNKLLSDTSDKIFNYNNEHKALSKGIALGNKSDFNITLSKAMQYSGIIHISAVSGMHIVILFNSILLLLQFFRFNKKLIYISIIPMLIMFLSVTAFSPSCARAVLMLIVFLLSFLIRRDYDSISALFFSAFVILVINPFTLYSISFQLSFASTLSILLLAPEISDMLKFMDKIPFLGRILKTSISISLSCVLGTSWLIAYYLGTFSVSSIITNLWIFYLVYGFFAGYFLCLIFYPITPWLVMNILRLPVAGILQLIINTAYKFSSLTFLYKDGIHLTRTSGFIYYGILAILYITKKQIDEIKHQSAAETKES